MELIICNEECVVEGIYFEIFRCTIYNKRYIICNGNIYMIGRVTYIRTIQTLDNNDTATGGNDVDVILYILHAYDEYLSNGCDEYVIPLVVLM